MLIRGKMFSRSSRLSDSCAERLSHFFSTCIAIFTPFRRRLLYHCIDGSRNRWIALVQKRQWFLYLLHHYADRGRSCEGNLSIEHLEQDDAKFIDIRPVVNFFSACHLWSHVFGSTDNHACASQRLSASAIFHHTRNTKVSQHQS